MRILKQLKLYEKAKSAESERSIIITGEKKNGQYLSTKALVIPFPGSNSKQSYYPPSPQGGDVTHSTATTLPHTAAQSLNPPQSKNPHVYESLRVKDLPEDFCCQVLCDFIS